MTDKKVCVHCGKEFIVEEPFWKYCLDCQDNYEYAPCYAAEKRIIENSPSSFLKRLRSLFYW